MAIVTLKYDSSGLKSGEVLTWAKEHCTSYITCALSEKNSSYYLDSNIGIDYFFGDEKDAALFSLRWL